MPPRLPPVGPRFSWRPAPFLAALFVSLCAGALLTGVACQDPEPFRNQLLTDGGFDETGGSGPTGGTGGGATGGKATGGVATGGTATGGVSTGGAATGGAASGGKATGGAATGGAATGGAATGGAATGGAATGGLATGGAAPGGSGTGGVATGGVGTGGAGGGSGNACFTQARALCSTCKENGNSLQKTCEDVLDCVVAHWPCTGNCMSSCLNASSGSGVVQTCVSNDLKMCQ